MKISLLLGAACSAASGIGMIMASGTLAGVFVGLGALYCAGAVVLLVQRNVISETF
jgi:hypothetical protein